MPKIENPISNSTEQGKENDSSVQRKRQMYLSHTAKSYMPTLLSYQTVDSGRKFTDLKSEPDLQIRTAS